MNIDKYLKYLVESNGSDLHLKVGRPPLIRVLGDLFPTELPTVTKQQMDNLVLSMLSSHQKKKLEDERELDFSYLVEGLARFRGNVFFQLGELGAVFRAIPIHVKTLDELEIPEVLKELIFKNQGIILITGPTGSGKSTTLASAIDLLNESVQKHIISIEDPIEFVHFDKKCTVSQREVGSDTLSFAQALKRALRQDPDIILVGEMRDAETIQIAMTAAETGHLVFSTLHTNDAKQSIDRIVDTFGPDQQHQVRMQLAVTLVATLSQRLIKKSNHSAMTPIVEVMINTPMVKKLIEEGKTGQIDKVIADSAQLYKMQTMNQHLYQLVRGNVLTREDALNASNNPNDLRIMFQTQPMIPKRDLSTKQAPGSKLPWIK